MDEASLIIAGVIFLLAPLPLCIFLLIRTSKLSQRIAELERLDGPATAPLRSKSVPSTMAPPTPAVEGQPNTVKEQTAPPQEQPRPTAIPTAFTKQKRPTKTPPKTVATRPQFNPIEGLRSIGLWPPKNLENREAGLIQWLAPRLGGILAALTVIFGSVYISSGSPPWIRLCGIVTLDLAVLGLAKFLWKKQKRFATVLAGTGFAMLYLTSIAAYAAPPVRIFLNPITGIGAQFATIALILTTSVWIRERGIALTAITFGFISAIFATIEGLAEAALISSLLLYITVFIANRHFKWSPLVSLASVGVYLPGFSLILVFLFENEHLIRPNTNLFLAYLGISVSLLPLSSLVKALQQKDTSVGHLRFQNSANTALALLCGYAYFKLLQIDLLHFYGPASIVFVIWTVLLARLGLKDLRFQLFLIKGSGLVALWLVNYFSGDIRWFALSLQALIIAFLARLSKSNWQKAASIALWLVSMHLARESVFYNETTPWSLSWFLMLSLVPIAILSQSLLFGDRENLSRFQNIVSTTMSVINGLLAILFIRTTEISDETLPLYYILYGVLIALIAFFKPISKAAAAIPATFLCLAANIMFWQHPYSSLNIIIISAVTIAGSKIACTHLSRSLKALHRLPEFCLSCLWVISVFAYTYNLFQETQWMPVIAPLLSIGIFVLSEKRFRNLADLSIIPIILMLITASVEPTHGYTSLLGLALTALYLAYPFFRHDAYYALGITRNFPKWRTSAHLALATWITVDALQSEWLRSSLLLTASLPLFYCFWRLHRHRIALASLLGLLLVAVSRHTLIWASESSVIFENLPWGWEYLSGGGALVSTCILLGVAINKQAHRKLKTKGSNLWSYLFAIVAFTVSGLTFSYHSLNLAVYFTPIMAAICLLFVGLGIGFSIKAYRLVGIVGLVLPISRLFIHDIRETLYRIIAFAVLSVLLGLIGYLYSRFQSKIK